ncbi:arylsulfatase J-like [Eriocheir sinensis]|uniref:arylsulfatase J-like n=1 Tax=Eriocheir sinensis TaxID=95602 RepID=UPI0021C9CABD|nr:arylsulfatase J-like [Eriocheir sinensis]XP_050735951.1 arylsulfatase J-like [Eriocheir sinensis]XP_050735952.1 arylsulfatase J-like [Eriocheir sinensis]XP_050735953.1 arylsulfatase J-like [Eriocheir sinensis]
MTQLKRVLVLSGLLSVWDQGGGGGGEGEGGALEDHSNQLHHHHHHEMQQVTTNDPHLWKDAHLDAREREKNLIIPLVPPSPSPPPSPFLLKQHTWPLRGGGGGDLDVSESEDILKKRKGEEGKKNVQRRRKLHLRKLKRKIKEENKRRKRQMRLANKRKGKKGNEGRPNIVFIVADDLGYNDVPWHNPDIHAPELHRLARHGIVLENHYVLPVCTPSRAALLTGRFPHRDGRQASFSPLSPTGLNTSLTLIPQHLQRLGYKTHLIGKWHLGYCSWAYTPLHRGFDSFYGYYLGSQGYYDRYKRVLMPQTRAARSTNRRQRTNKVIDNIPPAAEESGEPADVQGRRGHSTSLEMMGGGDAGGKRREGREVKTEALSAEEMQLFRDGGYDFRLNETPLTNVTGVYSNDLYAARVEEVIKGHVRGSGGDPLFLLLSLQATHGPLEAPPPSSLRRGAHPPHIVNPARRTFHGMVAALDRVVGRLVRQLRRSGLYQNTLIVFSTDNGGNFRVGGNNFPLRGGKGSVYEGGTKGVSFIHSPLLPHVGHRYRGLMHLVDWRATLLHAARGPAHWPTRGALPLEEEEEVVKMSDITLRETTTETEEEVEGKKISDIGGTEEEEEGVVRKKRKRKEGEATLRESVEEDSNEDEEEGSGRKRRGRQVERKRKTGKEEEHEEEEKEEEDGDDSIDMWGSLLHNTPSPRTSFVYTLRKGPLRGAIRRRHWKLVLGVGGRYDGWVPPEDVGGVAGVGGYSWHTPNTRQLTHNPHLHPHHRYHHTVTTANADDVMLFNLRDDPLETTDLSSMYQEVVASLRSKLKVHARHSKHPHSPRDDPRGHPSLHGGFFTPGWCEPVV